MAENGIELDYTELQPLPQATTKSSESALYADLSSSSDSSSDGEIFSSDDENKKPVQNIEKLKAMKHAASLVQKITKNPAYRPSPTGSELPASADESNKNSRKRPHTEHNNNLAPKSAKNLNKKAPSFDFDEPPIKSVNKYEILSQQVTNISYKEKYETLKKEHDKTVIELEAAYTAIQCLIENGRKYFEKTKNLGKERSKACGSDVVDLRMQLKEAKKCAEEALSSRDKNFFKIVEGRK